MIPQMPSTSYDISYIRAEKEINALPHEQVLEAFQNQVGGNKTVC